MRIDPISRTQPAPDTSPEQPTGPNSPASVATSGRAESGGERAQLSGDRARVRSLAAQVNALPETRQEKVGVLGPAVRDGSYQVSAEQMAEAMISEMLARPAAADTADSPRMLHDRSSGRATGTYCVGASVGKSGKAFHGRPWTGLAS
jgi:flagellar biosynthesis anti-sigma factor FlgM